MKRTISAAIAAAAMLLAACGSSGSSATTNVAPTTSAGGATSSTTASASSSTSSASSSGSSSSTPSSGSSSTSTAASVTSASSTSGPTATGPATGEPIKVGFVNLEGGPVSLPEIRVGFEQAVKYVNAELGGVNGRPIQIAVSCNTDLTPDSSINCANRMIEANVSVVFQGVDVAADASLPLYKEAKLAQIVVFGVSPALNAAQSDVFAYIWSTQEGLAASLRAQKTLGAKKIVMAEGDSAAARSYGDTLIPQLAKEVGVDVKVVYYPPDVDWTTFTQTILADNPDGISFPAITDQDCLGMVPAMKAAGWKGPLHAGSCNLMLKTLDGATLDGVITHAEFTWASMVNDKTPQKVKDEIAVYEKYVGEANKDYVGGFSTLGFALGVTGSDMLKAVKGTDFSSAAVRAALPSAKGTVFFSEVPYNCDGTAWPGSSSCRSGMIFTKIGADKKRTEFDWSPVDVSDLKPK